MNIDEDGIEQMSLIDEMTLSSATTAANGYG